MINYIVLGIFPLFMNDSSVKALMNINISVRKL